MYREKSIRDYLNDLASRLPAPGGGSSAALSGAMAAALMSMVLNFTIGNPKYADFEETAKKLLRNCEELRKKFSSLFEEDMKSYNAVSEAYKLSKGTEDEKIKRQKAISEGLKKALLVPLEVCRNNDVLKAANHTLNAPVKVKDLSELNREELKRIGFDGEEFPFEAESYVGNHLMKTVVFNQFLERHNIKGIFQALRWDEHHARFQDEYFEHKEAAHLVPDHTRIRPILHFTEKDLWDTYPAFNIPYCVLYERGYRSLGAKTTTVKASDIPAWKQDLENTEERGGRRQDKEKAMERMRKLGYM